MTSTRRTNTDRERGAAAVEFALIAPLIVVILFAITEFGLALSKMEVYTSAAREGARYAAVHCRPEGTVCSSSLIASRVQNSAIGYPIGGTPTANRDCSAPGSIGSQVTVSWLQPITIKVPFLPTYNLNVNVAGTFRCE
jgi:Flp pilus assembly protein TadG